MKTLFLSHPAQSATKNNVLVYTQGMKITFSANPILIYSNRWYFRHTSFNKFYFNRCCISILFHYQPYKPVPDINREPVRSPSAYPRDENNI